MRTPLLQRGFISVSDFRCTAGPDDRPFVEQFDCHSISYVRKGSFGCRTRGRSFELVAGSILVGHPGDEYLCSHDHCHGDECLSFFLTPELVEAIGDRTEVWRVGATPPLPELMVLGELAQATAEGRNDVGLDEIGQVLANRFVEVVSGRTPKPMPAAAQGSAPRGRNRAVDRRAIRTGRSISNTPPPRPRSARSISCGCSRACSASPRTSIWCARGCAMPRDCWPTMKSPSPTSPTTSVSPISPISSAPSTAPPGFRHAGSVRHRSGNRKIFQERLALH